MGDCTGPQRAAKCCRGPQGGCKSLKGARRLGEAAESHKGPGLATGGCGGSQGATGGWLVGLPGVLQSTGAWARAGGSGGGPGKGRARQEVSKRREGPQKIRHLMRLGPQIVDCEV